VEHLTDFHPAKFTQRLKTCAAVANVPRGTFGAYPYRFALDISADVSRGTLP